MAQLTLSIDMIVDIPNAKHSAKVTRVVNSFGNDITAVFNAHCAAQQLSLNSQSEIEVAINQFTAAHANNSSVLP